MSKISWLLLAFILCYIGISAIGQLADFYVSQAWDPVFWDASVNATGVFVLSTLLVASILACILGGIFCFKKLLD